ncbi:MAG: sigma 54-interacting transcriptional regulator [Bacteroidales bacterium]|nr:sigma 54-interacting transcriptional regulator [Bacteroidales bacterium]
MFARLVVESGDCVPTMLDLQPDQPVTLGRSRDNSIIVKDDMVSRLHAKVYYDAGRWVLRDFGLNGTKLAGNRINGATDLTDGSFIEFGDVRIRFLLTTNPPPSPSTDTPMPVAGAAAWAERVAAGERFGSQLGKPIGSSNTPVRTAAEVKNTKVQSHLIRQPMVDLAPSETGPLTDPMDTQLRVDELTALNRYMTNAVSLTDQQELIRTTLLTILHQTSATVAGYLSLDPTEPSPKIVMPERASVDTRLSRRLTERIRAGQKRVWLFGDVAGQGGADPGDSLSAFADAVCLPVAGPGGGPMAALHVYRTGRGFLERDVRFLEAVAGFLTPALETLRARRKLEAENSRLRGVAPVADELIGDSSAVMTLRGQIARAAPQPFTVLIHGESGSGKELVAQALHHHSTRAEGPLVVVNCAAIAPTLLEAELFGYRKGAFSGADRDHPGLFEQADDGTLFLDEVGELSLECQAKLLRVIEAKAFRPVGSVKDVKVDVRVIAATHRDLDAEVKAGRFRQDLLFRLKVITLRVPSLRDHSEDIPELARFFLERLSVQCRRSFRLTPEALRRLQSYSWPGNVRQLRAVLESAAVMSETEMIDVDSLPIGAGNDAPVVSAATVTDVPQSLDLDEIETWAIHRALRQTQGNVSQAARVLGMSRDTLHTKLKKKGIDRGALRQDGE